MKESHASSNTFTARTSTFDSSFSSSTVSDSMELEDIHTASLAASLAQHQHVRDTALRAFENYRLQEHQLRLQQIARQEAERLRLEQEQANLAAHIIQLQRQSIPIPQPPLVEEEPEVQKPAPAPAAEIAPSPHEPSRSSQSTIASAEAAVPPPATSTAPPQSPARISAISQQAQQTAQSQQPRKPESTNGYSVAQAPPTLTIQQPSSQPAWNTPSVATNLPHILPGTQKYLEIHKVLKRLRAFVASAASQDKAFKMKMGDGRRQIRKSVGQLTDGAGANSVPLQNIMNVLKDSLSVQSPPMDPSTIMCSPPTEEVVGAINNGSMLPTLFIYFLNIFAKSIVSQFINEAGVSPKAATPIGTIAVTVFAKPDFLWRGQTLIDILMCKMRVSCPVLFGMRGSEKTEEGRARIGWKRESGHWIDEQVHASRMTGLAAGYAAMSLRDFSRSKAMKNPWPATNYWISFASIVDTPPGQACSTQYTVLKAMIENHEDRFLRFYGDAAKAALYIGCVVFPARAVEKSVAVSALSVTADRLLKDVGLRLTPPQAPSGQGVMNSSSGFGAFH